MVIQLEVSPFEDATFNTYLPQISAECKKWVGNELEKYDSFKNDSGNVVINIRPSNISITYEGAHAGSRLFVERMNDKFLSDAIWDKILIRITGPGLN